MLRSIALRDWFVTLLIVKKKLEKYNRQIKHSATVVASRIVWKNNCVLTKYKEIVNSFVCVSYEWMNEWSDHNQMNGERKNIRKSISNRWIKKIFPNCWLLFIWIILEKCVSIVRVPMNELDCRQFAMNAHCACQILIKPPLFTRKTDGTMLAAQYANRLFVFCMHKKAFYVCQLKPKPKPKQKLLLLFYMHFKCNAN